MPKAKKYPECMRIADAKKREEALAVLAQFLADEHDAGTPWDGPNGLRAQGYVPTAQKARELMREHAKRGGKKVRTGNGIVPSYERTPAFRQAEAERRQAKAEAERKAAEKAERAAKRAAKAAAKDAA